LHVKSAGVLITALEDKDRPITRTLKRPCQLEIIDPPECTSTWRECENRSCSEIRDNCLLEKIKFNLKQKNRTLHEEKLKREREEKT